ncbi:MAG TPA: hypothetical protein VIN09_11515, partial [Chloroflexota bacterium]
NGDGVFDPSELRTQHHIVIAHNTFGQPGVASTGHPGYVAGSDVLVKENVLHHPVGTFFTMNGKCSVRFQNDPRVVYRFEHHYYVGNRVQQVTTFAHEDGTRYSCLSSQQYPFGHYEVLDNAVVSASGFQRMVQESGSVASPKVVSGNTVAGNPAP